ncbi:MAG TPA: patatin-like phospholipase family protein [bacterium]|nr:hypothetical protein [Myxococcales bacterium]HPW44812.1 patatin-like phospholipase family protein [bacterium]HQG13711.1 patatin-like phospholipase family protein [bacterium]HQH80116.1 patatin-like phospholipase family protein [bacterium]
MGITIVQRSAPSHKVIAGKKALIMAGGAVTGASFKAGGLKALNDYFGNFSVNNFDLYVGISSGSLIAAPLVGGISPESILKSLDGTSGHFSPLSAWHYYKPNFAEMLIKPLHFAAKLAAMLPGKLLGIVSRYPDWSKGLFKNVISFLENPTAANYDSMVKPILGSMEDFPSFLEILPSGVFDNSAIELYVRKNIERNGLTNDFREIQKISGKLIYISAMRLDDGKRVIFGPDENNSITLSEAIQASTAVPGFYKPARIGGVDYVDGGVQRTANIDIAIDKGAKLIICYNPFRPFEPKGFVDDFNKRRKEGRYLSSSGIMTVLNQIMRAFFHSRLKAAIDYYRRSPDFNGDIILIEPQADDEAFFALNPLSFKNRIEAAKLGFLSVRNSVEEKFDEVKAILQKYGIEISRDGVENKLKILSGGSSSPKAIQLLLEGNRKKVRSPGKMRVKRAISRMKSSSRKAKRS